MNLLSKINKFINNNKKLKNYMITFLIIFTIFFLFNNIHIYEGFKVKFNKDDTLPNASKKNQEEILQGYVNQTSDLVHRNKNISNAANNANTKAEQDFQQASLVESFVSKACDNKCNGNLTQLGSYNNNSNSANKLCQAMNLQKCEMESLNKNLL
tara:strand:- start:40 stop:504 length:465 start_codon:yes stop_codon:yes gene_type:complete